MFRLDLSLPSPAENLALDEALLLDESIDTSLRFWKSAQTVVVIGRGSKFEEEVNQEFCRRQGIAVLRRCSGGAAIVAGPGCLMYNVVVRLPAAQTLPNVDRAHEYVMSRVLAAVQRQQPAAQLQGICDLTLDGRKFSGNSLRVTRDRVLYHGTILLQVDRDLVENCLLSPPRTPDYRGGRAHRDFITSIELDETQFKDDMAEIFEARMPLSHWPEALVKQLVQDKYGCDEWTRRH